MARLLTTSPCVFLTGTNCALLAAGNVYETKQTNVATWNILLSCTRNIVILFCVGASKCVVTVVAYFLSIIHSLQFGRFIFVEIFLCFVRIILLVDKFHVFIFDIIGFTFVLFLFRSKYVPKLYLYFVTIKTSLISLRL